MQSNSRIANHGCPRLIRQRQEGPLVRCPNLMGPSKEASEPDARFGQRIQRCICLSLLLPLRAGFCHAFASRQQSAGRRQVFSYSATPTELNPYLYD